MVSLPFYRQENTQTKSLGERGRGGEREREKGGGVGVMFTLGILQQHYFVFLRGDVPYQMFVQLLKIIL